MLMSLHDKVKGWFAYLIIGGIAFVFVLWGVSNYLFESPQTAVVATVNGEKIYYQEFMRLFQLTAQRQEEQYQQGNSPFPVNEKLIKAQTLKKMIDDLATLTHLRSQGYAISSQDVLAELSKIPEFQDNGVFSKERFEEIARMNNLTAKYLFDKYADSILVSELPQGLLNSQFILPTEQEAMYRVANEKRQVGYLMVPRNKFIHDVKIDEKELKAYYDKNRANFMTDEKVKLDYITFSLDDAKKEVKVTQDEIADYYAEHKQEYTTEPLWHLAHILIAADDPSIKATTKTVEDSLKKGEDFATLAKSFSSDKSTAEKAGDLGWMTKKEMPAEFVAALGSISSTSPISAPITSRYGVHFVKYIAEKPAEELSLAQVQEEIKTLLTQNKANDLYMQWHDDVGTAAYENSDSLASVASTFNWPLKQSESLTRAGTEQEPFNSQKVIQAAFSDDVLKDHNNSDVIALDPTHSIVIRVNSYEPQRQETFDAVKSKINTLMSEEKAAVLTQQQGEAILKKLQDGASAEETAAVAGVEWHQQKDLTRDNHELAPYLLKRAFSLYLSKDPHTSIAGIVLPSGDYAVIKLNAVNPAVIGDKNDKSYADFGKQLSRTQFNTEYAAYLAAAHAQSKITSNPKYLN